jgi:hypothetical protein
MQSTMRNLALGAAVIAMGFMASAPARADVTLYDQPTDLNGSYTSQNDTNGLGNYATAYDNFTLTTASTIDSVDWVGNYFSGSPSTITSFAVSFYADSSGTPGSRLATTKISGNANETSLGTDKSGDPVFSYTAAVTPFSAAAGTQYWLSIVPSLGYPPQWGWETGTGGDGSAYQVGFGIGFQLPSDLAFTLVDNPAVASVPEPSTMMTASIGALAMLGYACRRRYLRVS